MLTPEIAERNILNSIENNESYVLCKERGVDKDTFFVYKEEWEFIDEDDEPETAEEEVK